MTATSVVTTLLWNALEASLLTVVLVGFLRWRKFSAPLRHLLWLLVLTKLFMPPVAFDSYGFSGACHEGWRWLSEHLETTVVWEGPEAWNGKALSPEPLPSDDGRRDGSAFSFELLSARPITTASGAFDNTRSFQIGFGSETRSGSPDGRPDDSAYVTRSDSRLQSARSGEAPAGENFLSEETTKLPGMKQALDASLAERRTDTASTVEATASVVTGIGARFDAATTARVLVFLWGFGALAILLRQALSIGAFHVGLRKSKNASPEVRRECVMVARRLGLRQVPTIRVLQISTPPLVWALGRPIVVLPRLTARSSAATLRALLAHELAHIKRRDHWLCWFELVGTCIYWWLPTFWWAQREMRRASDEAADAWAVWALRSRDIYAEALLETVVTLQTNAPRARVPLLGRGVGQKESLARRLTMIMRDPIRLRLSWTARLGALLIAVLVLPSSPFAATGTARIETPEPADSLEAEDPREAVSDKQPEPNSGQPKGIQPEAVSTPREILGDVRQVRDRVRARKLLQNLATQQSRQAPEQPLRAPASVTSTSADVEERLNRVERNLERVAAQMERLEKLLTGAAPASRRTFPLFNSNPPEKPKDEPLLVPPVPKRADPPSTRPRVGQFRFYALPAGKVGKLAEFLRKHLNVDAGVVPFLGEKGLGLTATKEIHDVVGPLISLMRKAPSAADDAHTSRPITARVTAVDRAKGLVVLNVGRDQGVEKGFEFVIHRRRQRIADLEVFEVYPDLSGARIKAVYEGQGIRQGDHAYFPLSTRP